MLNVKTNLPPYFNSCFSKIKDKDILCHSGKKNPKNTSYAVLELSLTYWVIREKQKCNLHMALFTIY